MWLPLLPDIKDMPLLFPFSRRHRSIGRVRGQQQQCQDHCHSSCCTHVPKPVDCLYCSQYKRMTGTANGTSCLLTELDAWKYAPSDQWAERCRVQHQQWRKWCQMLCPLGQLQSRILRPFPGTHHTGARGQSFPPNVYGGSFPTGCGGFPNVFPSGGRFQGFMPPRPPQGFPQAPPVGPPLGLGPPPGLKTQPYCAPMAHGSTYVAPGMPHAHIQQQPYSNTVKRYSNWNVCYSCGFDVAKGHISMSCPPYLRKASHNIYFTCQNAQQCINLGHPCSTKNRHKTLFPPNMWRLGAAIRNIAFKYNEPFYVNTTNLRYPTNFCLAI